MARGEQGATLASTDAFRDGQPFDLIVRDGVVPARVTGAPRKNAT